MLRHMCMYGGMMPTPPSSHTVHGFAFLSRVCVPATCQSCGGGHRPPGRDSTRSACPREVQGLNLLWLYVWHPRAAWRLWHEWTARPCEQNSVPWGRLCVFIWTPGRGARADSQTRGPSTSTPRCISTWCVFASWWALGTKKWSELFPPLHYVVCDGSPHCAPPPHIIVSPKVCTF